MIDKRDIILSEGVPVELTDMGGNNVQTIALLGRANKQFNSTVSLESHRRAQFLPDIEVDSGDIVLNTVTNERYIIVAAYNELIQAAVAAVIGHAILCNTKLTVSRMVEVVNARGDIVKTDTVQYEDIDVFTQAMTSEMRQQNPGLYVDAEFIIYAPAIDINSLDKISLLAGTRSTTLKVVDRDYISYPGLVLIQACTETRT